MENYTQKKFLGLICRCKDEKYIEEFCVYYLSQGVDNIFIIDDFSDQNIYKNLYEKPEYNNKVHIIFFEHKTDDRKDKSKMKRASNLYKKIRNNFTWMIFVDVDEFIVTKKNKEKTIRNELETTFANVDCIQVPWVMMSGSYREKDPEKLLTNNIYRWNHNLEHKETDFKKFGNRYNSIESKSIFNCACFKDILTHSPKNATYNAKIVNSIDAMQTRVHKGHFEKLREDDIKQGYLLCYHYRITSKENAIKKLENNMWYSGFNLTDLISNDKPEIEDITMKEKLYQHPFYYENFASKNKGKKELVKIIWMYWEQGECKLKYQKKCIDEWIKINPTWNVKVLDYKKALNLIPELSDLKHLSVQLRSDYIRLALLDKIGGVWSDATVFPLKPLDTWIYDELKNNDIFMYKFNTPSYGRITSSWFIAISEPKNYLIISWKKLFFTKLKQIGKYSRLLSLSHHEMIDNLDNAKNLRHRYPYFLLHLSLLKLYHSDPKINKAINLLTKSEKGPHSCKKDAYMWKKCKIDGVDNFDEKI